MRPILFLDVSRLVRRYEFFGGPTGIDRIEMRFANWMLRQEAFEARPVTRIGNRLMMLRPSAYAKIHDTLMARWSDGKPRQFMADGWGVKGQFIAAERTLQRIAAQMGAKPLDAEGRPNVTLNVGHDGLDVAERFAGLPGPFAVLLHDLIPITHPEYDSRRATQLHYKRLETLEARADHVFTVSQAALDELLTRTGTPRFTSSVIHSGPGLPVATSEIAYDRPTFVHLSSIDRRKNLAFLLHIWREFAGERDAPRLIVIGRRGNDQTALELIDRADALAGNVTVTGPLGDAQVAAHIPNARALLTPSFTEGFGLPIIEAHSMGVPVIASDIAAHREVGGAAGTYLSPLDGPAWAETIRAFAMDDEVRDQQIALIEPPRTWDDYFEEMTAALTELAHRPKRND
ncbi:glycosyltransferase family 4 protein [Acuticoccus yangtzensis]|uniref:glycosyltransferase family 4 protein n=1 Tax=Acuticoccus yangtzensis TaxID=1443441 RepID=UPI000AC8DAF0|nr:glycosyltransferase family 1 protein [Acuticoccus yangtzensis]